MRELNLELVEYSRKGEGSPLSAKVYRVLIGLCNRHMPLAAHQTSKGRR